MSALRTAANYSSSGMFISRNSSASCESNKTIGRGRNFRASMAGIAFLLAATGQAPTNANADWTARTSKTERVDYRSFAEPDRLSQIGLEQYQQQHSHLVEDEDFAIALREAEQFLNLLPSKALSPTPYSAEDGEVGFIWDDEDKFIDVSFYGDSHIYFYARIPGIGLELDDVRPYAGNAIPKEIEQALMHFPK